MNQDLLAKIGETLVCGFDGKCINDHARFLIRELRVSNWIYFSRNIESYEQLYDLTRDLRKETEHYTGRRPIISIDQEGGIVSRFSGWLNTYPGAMAIAATGKPENARIASRIIAEHLASIGVNMNLAPVCDVNSNPKNPIIGPRSFGDDPETVARFVCESIRGSREAGVIPVLKHFPGHGDTAVDSHHELPVLDRSAQQLQDRELIPFVQGISAGATAVMVGHLLLPSIDNTLMPASISKPIISGLLRTELGFTGLVCTDCLEMMGLARQYSSAESACSAISAGADLLFVSHTAEKQEESASALYDAVIAGRISETTIDKCIERIHRCKSQFAIDNSQANSATKFWEGGDVFPDERLVNISRASITILRNRSFIPSEGLPDTSETCIIVLLRPEQFIGENNVPGAHAVLNIKDAFPHASFHSMPAETEAAEVQRVIQDEERVLLVSADAAMSPPAVQTIQTITKSTKDRGRKAGVLLLRSPYEAVEFPDADCILLSYEDSVIAVSSLIQYLSGKFPAEGQLPVKIPNLA